MTIRMVVCAVFASAFCWVFLSGTVAQAQVIPDGTISLSPATARAMPGDTIRFDIVLDFNTVVINGGISMSWDPAVLTFVSWDFGTGTVGGETAFERPPVVDAVAGRLDRGQTGTPAGLMTPGVMATVTMRVRAGANTCQSALNIAAAPGVPWRDAAGSPLAPEYRSARVAAGTPICVSPPLDPRVADMPGRCIGVMPESPLNGATCPNPEGGYWDVAPLFGPVSPNDFGIAVPLADHMAKYCVYDRKTLVSPPGPAPTDCAELAPIVERERPGMKLEPASMAAGVQAAPAVIRELLVEPLQDQFLAQAGQLSVAFGDAPDGSVNLAIIDSLLVENFRAGADDPLPSHGSTLLSMLSNLSSGLQIRGDYEQIALPFNCFTQSTCLELCGDTEGCPDLSVISFGYLGTPESVAMAVHAAVVQWSQNANRARLVINASLGWLPQFNQIEGEARPGASAFMDSLREAACVGALVFAAAGNDSSGPIAADGLLYPAAAGLMQAPSHAECVALGYNPRTTDFPPTSRPLVYPVGAVTANGSRLLTRNNGEPSIVAFGDHATLLGTTTDGRDRPTLTGTSVASLVASVAAAAAWTADMNVAPHALVDILKTSGEDVGRDAEICLPGEACSADVKRVFVCDAYVAACQAAGLPSCPASCPERLPTQLDLTTEQLDELESVFDPAATRTISLTDYELATGVDMAPCNHNNSYVLYQSPAAAAPLNPCPQDQFYPTLETPWAKGQPEHQNCENCTMTERSPGKLFIEIRDDFGTEFQDPTLLEATLLCRDRATGAVNAFRLPDTDINAPEVRGYQPGERVLVTDIDVNLCPGDDIRLAFSAEDINQQGEYEPASLVQQLLVIRHDEDADAVPDFRDNCINHRNPDQRDSDGDGIGNRCDADIAIPNNCAVNAQDLGILKAAFFATPELPHWNPDADFDGNDKINVQDLGIMRTLFFGVPGPSALPNACSNR